MKKDDLPLNSIQPKGLKNDYTPSFFSVFASFVDYLAEQYENMRR